MVIDRSSLRRGEYGVNWASPQADGLIGWWPECKYDLVGGRHAVPTNGPMTLASAMGPAMSTNGTTNYSSIPHHASLINTVNLTIAFWIFPRTTANTKEAFSKRTSANTGFLTLDFTGTSGTFNFYFDQSSSGYQAGTDDLAGTLTIKKWSHLVFTWDANDAARLYINGAQVDSQAAVGALNTNTADIVLGADTAFGRLFDGMLRDVRIYHVTHSARSIAAMHNPATRYDLYLPHGRLIYSLPSTAIRTVTVKSSGGDYSSLAAAEAGEQGDLVSLNRQLDIECYAFEDTTACNFNGWTTDATRYIRVYAASGEGHSGVWSTSKYRIRSSAGFGSIVTVTEEYVRLEGLQIYQSSGSYTALVRIAASISATSDVRLDRCLLRGTGSTLSFSALYQGGGTATARNCVVYGSSSDGVEVAKDDINDAALSLDNCTVAGCGTYGLNRPSSGTLTLRNCYSGGNGTDAYNGTMTRTTCAHSSATVFSGSTASVAHSTANFVNVTSGSEDYHIVTGSALIGAGTDLSSDFTTDIDGDTRSEWSIGADDAPELVYAATASLTVSGATTAGSATFAPGTKTASAAVAVSGATASGSSEFTAPTYTAAAALTAAAAAVSSEATFTAPVYEASAEVAVNSSAASGSAEFTVPTYAAAAAAVVAATTAVASATAAAPVYAGAANVAASSAAASGSATFAQLIHSGIGTTVIEPAVASGLAAFSPPIYSAAASAAVATATASGSASAASPTYTSAATLLVTATTASGVSAFTVPVYAAAASVMVAAATATGAATAITPTYTAMAAVTMAASTAGGLALSTAPTYAATASVTTSATTATATAAFAAPVHTGTIAASVTAITATGLATFTEPTTHIAVGAVTVSRPIVGGFVAQMRELAAKYRLRIQHRPSSWLDLRGDPGRESEGTLVKYDTESILYDYNFSRSLPSGETITTAQAEVIGPSGLDLSSVSHASTLVYARLSGGTPGRQYTIDFTATTSSGNIRQGRGRLRIVD